MTISRRFFLLSSAVLASAPAAEIAHAASRGPSAVTEPLTVSPSAPPAAAMSELSHDLFMRHLNATFRAHNDTQGVRQALTLVATREAAQRRKSWASRVEAAPGAGRFSLVFQGPLDRPLPQEVYMVELRGVGEWSLLLVPVHHRDSTNRYYEAIINRL